MPAGTAAAATVAEAAARGKYIIKEFEQTPEREEKKKKRKLIQIISEIAENKIIICYIKKLEIYELF